ncbi:hypothetical protein AB0F81_48075 [Actinoplanes sp. NPDC024001]|uniref:hypothetical protein n=1 Tax=Actinoplanes sp. NPDC024001 TaxID=3154598 RepID=UPI0033D728B6
MTDLAQVVAGTPPGGLPIGYGPGGTLTVQRVPPDRALHSWQAAFDLMPVTGH